MARSYIASPGPASDQSITPVISSPSTNTWETCSRAAAPAAAHAAADAVEGSPRRPSDVPETAASATTGGRRHRTSGTGIGATAIASTSTSSTPAIIAGMPAALVTEH